MQQFIADVAEGVAIADVIQREHVKRPIIDILPKRATQSRSIFRVYMAKETYYYETGCIVSFSC